MQCDYYNRCCSGWEPLLETCDGSVTWTQTSERTYVSVSSRSVINLNVTPVLLQHYRDTEKKWRDEYLKVRYACTCTCTCSRTSRS